MRIAVHSAKKLGIRVAPDEIQERADQWCRVNGLHRAVAVNRYLEGMHVSLDEYEHYISDQLYYEHMMDQVVTEEAEQMPPKTAASESTVSTRRKPGI